MTSRALSADIQNALDFLSNADLALYPNPVAVTASSVSWQTLVPGASFLLSRGTTAVEQYLEWIRTGSYSVVLRDGGMLQMSYSFDGNTVVGHRLAYVPCPVEVDEDLLLEEPIADVVALCLDGGPRVVALRSPVRFDYDPAAANTDHPAAHLSINNAGCRIACVAPLHPYRFIDFVFRHFYGTLRAANLGWFDLAATRQLGERVLSDLDRGTVHLTWPVDGGQFE